VCFCRCNRESKGFVQDVKSTVEAFESVNEFLFADAERRRAVDVRESVQSNQSIVEEGLLVLEESVRWGLVLELGVLAMSVLNVEASKEPNGTVLLDRRMVFDELLHAGLKERSNGGSSSDDIVLQEILGVFVGNGHGDRVSGIGGSPSHGLVLKVIQDFLVAGNHGHWDGRRGDTLGAGDDIGHDSLVVLETKHFSGTSESHHDLIHVHQNVVLVAESTNTLQESIGENDASSSSLDGFGHDGSNIVWSLVEDLFLEHDKGRLDLFGLGGIVAARLEEEWERIKGLDKVWGLLSKPASRIASGGARVGGGAVVSTVPADNLLLASESASHHDSSLVGLGSTGWVDGSSEVSGENLVHELVHARLDLGLSHVTVDVWEVSELVLGSLNNILWQVVSKVGADSLGSPVEVSVSLVVIEVDSLSVGHVWNCVSSLAGSPSHGKGILCSGLVQVLGSPCSEWLKVSGVDFRGNIGRIVFGVDGRK